MLSNPLAIGTLSLGQHANHFLEEKLRIAASSGFQGVEIVYSDLRNYAYRHGISIAQSALEIKDLCEELKLTIIALAPFENFEGHQSPLSDRLARADEWLRVASQLRAAHLQVPALYDHNCTGDMAVIVDELRKLSDLASVRQPPIKIAYEPMSWSIHFSTWEATLDLINSVDRANFGLCLDSFHILTKLWASPYQQSGKLPNADGELNRSLQQFKKQFPLQKLFYVQLSDAEIFDPPFSEHHPWYLEGEAAQFTWSKHARPFPLETEYGAYTPVSQFLRETVLDTGFNGWISFEIFDRRMRDESFEPHRAGQRAKASWSNLQADMQGTRLKI